MIAFGVALIKVMVHVLGIPGTVLSWFRSYLTKRFHIVSTKGTHSDQIKLCCGVPQGSVLGPILFILYTQPLTSGILKNPVSHMQHGVEAEDTQVYNLFRVLKNVCPISKPG